MGKLIFCLKKCLEQPKTCKFHQIPQIYGHWRNMWTIWGILRVKYVRIYHLASIFRAFLAILQCSRGPQNQIFAAGAAGEVASHF